MKVKDLIAALQEVADKDQPVVFKSTNDRYGSNEFEVVAVDGIEERPVADADICDILGTLPGDQRLDKDGDRDVVVIW